MRRAALCAATGVAAALAFAGPADAGTSPSLKVSKRASGPYTDSTISMTIDAGQKKDFFLKARNTSGTNAAAQLEETSPVEYTTKYFRAGKNITAEVKGGGYQFTLTAKAKRFRVVVKDAGGAPDETDCIIERLNAGIPHDEARVGINGSCP